MSGRIHLKSWCTMCLFLLGMGYTTAGGRTIYVDVDGNGLNDGSSWENAYNFLQDALADANSAVKPVEIRVAVGTYRPDRSSAEPNGTGDRTATFQLINGVTLKGGYAGLGEPDPNARDIEVYETVLSGDLNGDDVDVNGPGDLVYEPTRAENSYHVATAGATDPNAVLDGFTVTAGNAGGSYPNNYGGGMHNYGSPTLTNCVFNGNSAGRGGAIYNSGRPTLTNCTFSGNSAGHGGAMSSSGRPTLTNCIFNGNSAGRGGAIYNSGSLTLTNCTFNGNSAGRGGAIYYSWGPSTLSNCTFSTNTGTYGGAIFCAEHSHPFVVNCILWGNNASDGPEIAMVGIDWGSRLSISYSDVQGGQAGVVCVPYDGYPDLCRLEWGPGNIDADPCFVDAPNGDYHLKSEGWRWNANRKVWTWDDVSSPCIDAGNPGSPLGVEMLSVPDDPNNEWGQNLRINMGAYGGTAEASMALPGWALLADLTNDRIVDFNDLEVFVRYWLDSGEHIPSDLNHNQSADFSDFAIMALHWMWEE